MEAAKVLINTLNMKREDWLQWRKKGIGGSDASAICGVNKYKSPISLYLDKLELAPPEDIQSESAYWGTVMEGVLRKEFELRTGLKVHRRNAILQHPQYEFILANVDGVIVGKKIGLEIKTSSEYLKNLWLDEEVPEQYMIQCQHYMAVTGYEGWYICSLIGGNKFIYKYIPRDEELINMIINLEVSFWNNHIIPKLPPPVDGSESSSELLKMMYPRAESGSRIYLPSEYDNMLSEREELKTKIKELTEKKDAIENKIIAELKEAESAECEKFIVNYKNVNKTSLDTKSLKAKYPQYYTEFAKESSYRKFDVKARL